MANWVFLLDRLYCNMDPNILRAKQFLQGHFLSLSCAPTDEANRKSIVAAISLGLSRCGREVSPESLRVQVMIEHRLKQLRYVQ